MYRSVLITAVAAVALSAGSAQAQSASTSRTTTTTTTQRDGDTTRTTTRSTTTSGGVSIDADAALGALVGVLAGASGEGDSAAAALRRRAEPARAEDAFGVWAADYGGRATEGCRFEFGQRGFMGMRSVSTRGCPSRLAGIGNYQIQNGELVLWQNNGASEWGRLIYVDGRFVGGGLTLRREDDAGDGPRAEDMVDSGRGAAIRTLAGRGRAEDFAGTWRHAYDWSGTRRECTISLSTNPAFGALGASQSGCFNDLMMTTSWRVEDGRVVLLKAGGGVVATLRGGTDRLQGQTSGGSQVVLYR